MDPKLKLVLTLMRYHLDQHGLTDWGCRISVHHRKVGMCCYAKRLIYVSKWHVMHSRMEQVLDTIMHEVAHALNPGHGHDEVWQECARQLGATPHACMQEPSMIPAVWTAVCAICNRKYTKRRLLTRMRQRYYCTVCGPERGRLAWVRNR